MNRIRQYNGTYQVLITPSIKIAPDVPLMIGNWDDEELRNYYILDFPTLQAAQCEASRHPDIDWYRIVMNHKHIHHRLSASIQQIIADNFFTVEFQSKLMSPDEFKDTLFDRIMRGGERFNLRHGMNDLMTFTIINPWTANLHKMSLLLESHREHLHRDDLRIRDKQIVDGKTVCLYGSTELGTMYEIRLVPTIMYQWSEWFKKIGHTKGSSADLLYQKMMITQDVIDKTVIR